MRGFVTCPLRILTPNFGHDSEKLVYQLQNSTDLVPPGLTENAVYSIGFHKYRGSLNSANSNSGVSKPH